MGGLRDKIECCHARRRRRRSRQGIPRFALAGHAGALCCSRVCASAARCAMRCGRRLRVERDTPRDLGVVKIKERARNRFTGIHTRSSPEPNGPATVLCDIHVFVSRRGRLQQGPPSILAKGDCRLSIGTRSCMVLRSRAMLLCIPSKLSFIRIASPQSAWPGTSSDEATKKRFAKTGTGFDYEIDAIGWPHEPIPW